MSDKKTLSDKERQAFIDKLPKDQVNENAEEVFNEAIARGAKPVQLKPEKPDSADSYNDKQTHSNKAADTSH